MARVAMSSHAGVGFASGTRGRASHGTSKSRIPALIAKAADLKKYHRISTGRCRFDGISSTCRGRAVGCQSGRGIPGGHRLNHDRP